MTTKALRHHDPGSNHRRVNRRKGQRHTRDGVIAFVVACVLTGCMFGDDTMPYAHGGLVAYTTDCVPKECFYGCCTGPDAQPAPQLIGDEKYWDAPCRKLRKDHAAYSEYVDLMAYDINACTHEFYYEWGPCTPIPADAVMKITPDGGSAPAGFDFRECYPRGDWIAMPVTDAVIVPQDP
jgi:hypothetical protein